MSFIVRSTELADSRYRGLERWRTEERVSALVEGNWRAISACASASADISRAVDAAVDCLANGEGRLIYVGAGTSARVAVADLAELHPTFGWPSSRALTLMAGGDQTAHRESGGSEDSEEDAIAAVETAKIGPADVVVGIAASGRTPFTCAAVQAARSAGAVTIGISNVAEGRLLDVAQLGITLNTGAEVLAGSTRLAAGTSQKVALNSFSTAVMSGLGLIYQGRMIAMQVSNQKLQTRAIEMVVELCKVDEHTAQTRLLEHDWSIWRAMFSAFGYGANATEELLSKHHGRVAAALAEASGEPLVA